MAHAADTGHEDPGRVRKKQARILSEKNRLYWMFFALYLCGSTLVLSGTVLKTFRPDQAEE